MFEIITENVASSANELQNLSRSLSYMIESVEQVEKSLSEFSWGEGVRSQLSSNIRKLDDERQEMISFAMVTEKIAETYRLTEKKVVGNSEGGARIISNGVLSVKSTALFGAGSVKAANIRFQ